MAMEEEQRIVQNRGLLTEDDRQFWRDEKDADNPDKTRREKRHNVKQRIHNIKQDLEILAEAGEDDLVGEFHAETDRGAKLEEELSAIRQQLDEETR